MSTTYFLKSGLLGLALLGAGLGAQAQSWGTDSLRGPVPPQFLLKAGLRLTHLSYSPGSQTWRVVVPLSFGGEYRLAPRFGVYGQAEADLQASRAATGRRRSVQANALPTAALALGLRYYYNQPAGRLPLRNNNLYGNYIALEGSIERSVVTAVAVNRTRRQTLANLTPGIFAFWGTQQRLRRSMLYDLNAGLGVQLPPYYNYESLVPARYDIAAQVNIRVYWSRGFRAM